MFFGIEIELLLAFLSGAGVLSGGGVFAYNKLSNRSNSGEIKKQINQHIETLINLLSEVKKKHNELKPLVILAEEKYKTLSKEQKQELADSWERAVQLLLAKSRSFEKEKDELQMLMASEETRKVLNIKKISAINRILIAKEISLEKSFSALSLFSGEIDFDWKTLEMSLERAKLER